MSDDTAVTVQETHLQIIAAVSRKLSYSVLGSLAGFDELYSEALVHLTVASQDYDPSRTSMPFDSYLGWTVKKRLIDYLRTTYGRMYVDPDGNSYRSARMEATLNTSSLDDLMDEDPDSSTWLSWSPEEPSVEEVVIAKQNLYEVLEEVAQLPPHKRAAALQTITGRNMSEIGAQYGKTPGSMSYHRMSAIKEIKERMA